MGHYLVKFRIGENNRYVYPEKVADIVWKSVVYHHTELTMIGETEGEVEVDGRVVVELKPDEAKKLATEYFASYPKPEETTELFGIQRRRPRSSGP